MEDKRSHPDRLPLPAPVPDLDRELSRARAWRERRERRERETIPDRPDRPGR